VPHLLTNVLTFAVLGFMGVRLATGLRISMRRNGRSLVREIVTGIRWRHVWPIVVVLPAVVLTASALMSIPGLDWGWWSMLGGEGTPVFGSSSTTTGTAWEWIIPLAFITMLVPALPLFAHAEERIFRAGAEQWSPLRRTWKVVQFGMAHALIGIPLGAALALSVGGAYFMAVYLRAWQRVPSRRAATIESARAHTAYNAFIVALVMVLTLSIALA
jgi:hypothetical protein